MRENRPMSTWGQTDGTVDYAPVGPALELVEGEQISFPLALKTPERTPHDLTAWHVSASCSFHLAASLRKGYEPMTISGRAAPALNIPVRLADQGDLPGVAYLDFPANALPAGYDVAPNANPFPLGLVAVSARSPDPNQQIYIVRFPVIWRDRDGA